VKINKSSYSAISAIYYGSTRISIFAFFYFIILSSFNSAWCICSDLPRLETQLV